MSPEQQHHFLPHGAESRERRTRWVVALTMVTMVVEIVAGTITGSLALTADGWHMGTHALALGAAALAYHLARRWAGDTRYTFGTGKIGELSGFGSALALAIAALSIAAESIVRLFEPRPVDFSQAMLVALIGLGVNLVSALLLRDGHDHPQEEGDKGAKHRHGHSDSNLRAAYLHVLADALTSVLAIIALAAGLYAGVLWLDPAVGIVGAGVILWWSFGLLRDTASVLLDRVPDQQLAQALRSRLEAAGDARVTDLHLWQVAPGRYAVIIALSAADPQPPAAYKRRLGEDQRLVHVTIEVSAA